MVGLEAGPLHDTVGATSGKRPWLGQNVAWGRETRMARAGQFTAFTWAKAPRVNATVHALMR